MLWGSAHCWGDGHNECLPFFFFLTQINQGVADEIPNILRDNLIKQNPKKEEKSHST